MPAEYILFRLFDRIDDHRVVAIQWALDLVAVIAELWSTVRTILADILAKPGDIIFVAVALSCKNGLYDPLIICVDRAISH